MPPRRMGGRHKKETLPDPVTLPPKRPHDEVLKEKILSNSIKSVSYDKISYHSGLGRHLVDWGNNQVQSVAAPFRDSSPHHRQFFRRKYSRYCCYESGESSSSSDSDLDNDQYEKMTNSMDEEGPAKTIEILSALNMNNTVTTLIMSFCNFNDQCASMIAGCIQKGSPPLVELLLPWNEITDAGAIELANAFALSQKLKHIDLRMNRISHAGLEAQVRSFSTNGKLANLSILPQRLRRVEAESLHMKPQPLELGLSHIERMNSESYIDGLHEMLQLLRGMRLWVEEYRNASADKLKSRSFPSSLRKRMNFRRRGSDRPRPHRPDLWQLWHTPCNAEQIEEYGQLLTEISQIVQRRRALTSHSRCETECYVSVRLPQAGLDDSHAGALAGAISNCLALSVVDIRNNNFTEAGISQILEAISDDKSHAQDLEILVHGNALSPSSSFAISRGMLNAYTPGNCYLSEPTCAGFIREMKVWGNQGLGRGVLDLQGYQIRDGEAWALYNLLIDGECKCRELRLSPSVTFKSEDGFGIVLWALSLNTSLESVDLSGATVYTKGSSANRKPKPIGEGLVSWAHFLEKNNSSSSTSNLHSLSFSQNGVGDDEVAIFVHALERACPHLTHIDLSSNHITDRGAEALLRLVEARSEPLRVNLMYNPISTAVMEKCLQTSQTELQEHFDIPRLPWPAVDSDETASDIASRIKAKEGQFVHEMFSGEMTFPPRPEPPTLSEEERNVTRRFADPSVEMVVAICSSITANRSAGRTSTAPPLSHQQLPPNMVSVTLLADGQFQPFASVEVPFDSSLGKVREAMKTKLELSAWNLDAGFVFLTKKRREVVAVETEASVSMTAGFPEVRWCMEEQHRWRWGCGTRIGHKSSCTQGGTIDGRSDRGWDRCFMMCLTIRVDEGVSATTFDFGLGWTDLHHAVDSGDQRQVDAALQNLSRFQEQTRQAKLSMRDWRGRNVLHLACERNNAQLVSRFCTSGVSMEADIYGNTPWHIAIKNKCWSALVALLDNASREFFDDKEDRPAPFVTRLLSLSERPFLPTVDEAIATGSLELLEAVTSVLEKEYHTESPFDEHLLHVVVRTNHLELVKFVLQSPKLSSPQALFHKDTYGNTPLHVAVTLPSSNVAKALITAGDLQGSRQDIVRSPNNSGRTITMLAVQSGFVDVVEALGHLLQPEDFTAHDCAGSTVMHIAAATGRTSVVRLLHTLAGRVGVEVCDLVGRSRRPQSPAVAQMPQSVRARLTINHPRLFSPKSTNAEELYFTPLFIAALGGHVEIVELFLDWGVRVDPLVKSWCAVHRDDRLAAVTFFQQFSDSSITRRLYGAWDSELPVLVAVLPSMRGEEKDGDEGGEGEEDQEVQVPDEPHFLRNVIQLSLWSSSVDEVDVHATDAYGQTPLFEIVKSNNVGGVHSVIRRGADVNAKDTEGLFPLLHAAHLGHGEVVSALIERGADADQRDKGGRTAMSAALEAGHQHVVDILMAHRASQASVVDDEGMNYCHWAAIGGVSPPRDSSQSDMNASDKYGMTPLQAAVFGAHAEVVEQMCALGADPNLVTNMVHEHFLLGHILTDDGSASPTTLQPAEVAWRSGNPAMLLALVRAGATLSFALPIIDELSHRQKQRANEILESFLDYCKSAAPALMEELSACTAAPPMPCFCSPCVNREGKFSVSYFEVDDCKCCCCKFTEVFLILRDVGGDPDGTQFLVATYKGDLEFVHNLLWKGQDPRMVEPETKSSALTYACCQGDSAMAQLLLDAGADANHKDKNGCTPLLAAVSSLNLNLVKALLEYGADVNLSDKTQTTPLHSCSIVGDSAAAADIARALLEHGADTSLTDKARYTPLQQAIGVGASQVALAIMNGSNTVIPTTIPNVDSLGLDPVAITGSYRPIVDALNKQSPQRSDEETNILIVAVLTCSDEVAKVLLNKGGDALTSRPQEVARTAAMSGWKDVELFESINSRVGSGQFWKDSLDRVLSPRILAILFDSPIVGVAQMEAQLTEEENEAIRSDLSLPPDESIVFQRLMEVLKFDSELWCDPGRAHDTVAFLLVCLSQRYPKLFRLVTSALAPEAFLQKESFCLYPHLRNVSPLLLAAWLGHYEAVEHLRSLGVDDKVMLTLTRKHTVQNHSDCRDNPKYSNGGFEQKVEMGILDIVAHRGHLSLCNLFVSRGFDCMRALHLAAAAGREDCALVFAKHDLLSGARASLHNHEELPHLRPLSKGPLGTYVGMHGMVNLHKCYFDHGVDLLKDFSIDGFSGWDYCMMWGNAHLFSYVPDSPGEKPSVCRRETGVMKLCVRNLGAAESAPINESIICPAHLHDDRAMGRESPSVLEGAIRVANVALVESVLKVGGGTINLSKGILELACKQHESAETMRIVQALLDSGARPHGQEIPQPAFEGFSGDIIDVTAFSGNMQTLQMIIQQDFSPICLQSLLCIACVKDLPDLAAYCITSAQECPLGYEGEGPLADINLEDSYGYRPVHLCVAFSSFMTLAVLLQHGAEFDDWCRREALPAEDSYSDIDSEDDEVEHLGPPDEYEKLWFGELMPIPLICSSSVSTRFAIAELLRRMRGSTASAHPPLETLEALAHPWHKVPTKSEKNYIGPMGLPNHVTKEEDLLSLWHLSSTRITEALDTMHRRVSECKQWLPPVRVMGIPEGSGLKGKSESSYTTWKENKNRDMKGKAPETKTAEDTPFTFLQPLPL